MWLFLWKWAKVLLLEKQYEWKASWTLYGNSEWRGNEAVSAWSEKVFYGQMFVTPDDTMAQVHRIVLYDRRIEMKKRAESTNMFK